MHGSCKSEAAATASPVDTIYHRWFLFCSQIFKPKGFCLIGKKVSNKQAWLHYVKPIWLMYLQASSMPCVEMGMRSKHASIPLKETCLSLHMLHEACSVFI